MKTKLYIFVVFSLLLVSAHLFAQGSYSTSAYGTASLPGDPQITANISGPVLTTDWCANLAFNADDETQPLIADPLVFVCDASGVNLGAISASVAYDNYYISEQSRDLSVSSIDMTTSKPLMDGYSDWSVTASWNDGDFKAEMAHGSPFIYLSTSNGIEVAATASVWYNTGNVVGITVGDYNYALFAPTGASWTETATGFESDLDGNTYCSIALLPDSTESTLSYFKNYAFNFITGTVADYVYDEENSILSTTYTASLEQKESGSAGTIYALYPHQWLNYTGTTSGYTYTCARGVMQVVAGESFTTQMTYAGILPHLPLVAEEDLNSYSETQLRQYITDEYEKDDGSLIAAYGETYGTGVQMGRTAQLVRIANQLDMITERDRFIDLLETKLEGWLTYTSGEAAEYFYYDERWGTLIGITPSYGSDANLNDHHFHYGYYIRAAATVAQFDDEWVEVWGDMVELLIRDVNSWDHEDEMFPYMRGFDIYAGHSWASGDAEFASGNNQESSSEAINCASGIALWGMATNDTVIRDLGIFLYTTEKSALLNYWFDVNKVSFPSDFSHEMVGLVWGDKADYATWFGGTPDQAEYILGINILPVTAASLHFGLYPDKISSTYNELLSYGAVDEWQDIMYEYLAMGDPSLAASYLEGNPDNAMAGSPTNDSRAHTYHWIHNLNAMGTLQAVTANTASYSVFDDGTKRTYVVYNESETEETVTFSDGTEMTAPARELTYLLGESITTPVSGITIYPSTSSVSAGFTTQLSAVITPSTASDKGVSWSSDNIAVAAVSTTGFVTGITAGTATITVTSTDGGYTASCAVTVTPSTVTSVEIPAKIEAEDYTDMKGVEKEETTDADGGFNIGWIDSGDWLEYVIYAETAGVYTVNYRLSSETTGGELSLSSNGTVLSNTSFSATGGWQSWNTESEDVSLLAGDQTIRITAVEAGWNINWLEFTYQGEIVAVSGISVSPISVEITDGSTSQLTETLSPEDVYTKNVSWSSDNTTVASVSSTGLVTGMSEGTANITATSLDGGFTASSAVVVNASTSSLIGDAVENLIRVYPNPVNGVLTIALDDSDYTDIALYDISGKLVYTTNVDSGENILLVDVERFDHGIYTLVLKSNTSMKVLKVLKN